MQALSPEEVPIKDRAHVFQSLCPTTALPTTGCMGVLRLQVGDEGHVSQ